MGHWNVSEIGSSYRADAHKLLVQCQVKPSVPANNNNTSMVSANLVSSSSSASSQDKTPVADSNSSTSNKSPTTESVIPSSSGSSNSVAEEQSSESDCNVKEFYCPVCLSAMKPSDSSQLSCCHSFCNSCWSQYFDVEITQGITTSKSLYNVLSIIH